MVCTRSRMLAQHFDETSHEHDSVWSLLSPFTETWEALSSRASLLFSPIAVEAGHASPESAVTLAPSPPVLESPPTAPAPAIAPPTNSNVDLAGLLEANMSQLAQANSDKDQLRERILSLEQQLKTKDARIAGLEQLLDKQLYAKFRADAEREMRSDKEAAMAAAVQAEAAAARAEAVAVRERAEPLPQQHADPIVHSTPSTDAALIPKSPALTDVSDACTERASTADTIATDDGETRPQVHQRAWLHKLLVEEMAREYQEEEVERSSLQHLASLADGDEQLGRSQSDGRSPSYLARRSLTKRLSSMSFKGATAPPPVPPPAPVATMSPPEKSPFAWLIGTVGGKQERSHA